MISEISCHSASVKSSFLPSSFVCGERTPTSHFVKPGIGERVEKAFIWGSSFCRQKERKKIYEFCHDWQWEVWVKEQLIPFTWCQAKTRDSQDWLIHIDKKKKIQNHPASNRSVTRKHLEPEENFNTDNYSPHRPPIQKYLHSTYHHYVQVEHFIGRNKQIQSHAIKKLFWGICTFM